MSTVIKPFALIVGTSDVDTRIPLIQRLVGFRMGAMGTAERLRIRFEAAGFPYYRYYMRRGAGPISDINAYCRLVFLFRAFKPDIVHAFDTKPCVWARLAARTAKVPVVIGTLPGGGSLYSDTRLSTQLIRSIYQPLLRLSAHGSDLTIFQNKDDLRQFTSMGLVPRNRCMTVPGSGIDTTHFCRERVSEAARGKVISDLGILPGQAIITLIARVLRSKGVLEFAAAASFVRQKHPNVRFLLVGPMDTESRDGLSAGELTRVRANVQYLGARDDIAAVLAMSDIFVLPSYYREGIPRVLMEAASMGLPLITVDAPGCREVVRDGENGIFIPPRDPEALAQAICTLVENAPLRESFGKVSRRRAVEEFDISIVAWQLKEIYSQLMERAAFKQTGRKSKRFFPN
jgi:glycosyltransferase involved in cell wall biosynthesis